MKNKLLTHISVTNIFIIFLTMFLSGQVKLSASETATETPHEENEFSKGNIQAFFDQHIAYRSDDTDRSNHLANIDNLSATVALNEENYLADEEISDFNNSNFFSIEETEIVLAETVKEPQNENDIVDLNTMPKYSTSIETLGELEAQTIDDNNTLFFPKSQQNLLNLSESEEPAIPPLNGASGDVDLSESVTRLARSRTDKKSFVTLYGGLGTNSNIGEALLLKNSPFYDSFFNDESFVGVELGRELLSRKVTLNFRCSTVRGTSCGLAAEWSQPSSREYKNFSLEWLGQMRQHFGERDYLALETALAVRWYLFPGNEFLNTSIAVGNGLSYVTDIPQIEAARPRNFVKSNILNYILIEATFALPRTPDWSLVLRLNHRSGAFGFFNGARDGSNNFALGIRHSF